jgi:hypothetical protein
MVIACGSPCNQLGSAACWMLDRKSELQQLIKNQSCSNLSHLRGLT